MMWGLESSVVQKGMVPVGGPANIFDVGKGAERRVVTRLN